MSEQPLYKDPSKPVEERVENLLSLMTVEEKVGQLTQLDGRVEMEKNYKEKHPGSFLQILGDDVKPAIKLARKSRLGIPLLLGVDAIHGHSFWNGATIFPTQLTMAATWNEELIEESASITAKEMRNTGVSWTFSPLFCLTRDLRWGRVGETFGEDPYLIGRFGAAMVRGYQGTDMSDPDKVLACAKHYAGYSETQGGRDASEADLSKRKLKSYFLPPFKKAVEAGVGSFMTGYQSMEGLPSTANNWLLRDVLKDEWGFDGFLVTDWNNVGCMVETQKTCPDYKTAAAIAVKAGNDLMMSTPNFFQGCLDAINEGMLDISDVEDGVRRILTIKFKLGLFEDDRYPEIDETKAVVGCAPHREKALQAARESAVLLKNDGILPLDENKIKKIAVIGPNADHAIAPLGDWVLGTGQAGHGLHPRECTITSLDGLKTRFNGEITYAPGCQIEEDDDKGTIAEAVAAAKDADIVVAVVGDRRKYYGEYRSTATLELMDGQNELLAKVAETGKPLVIVMINSKPLILPNNGDDANAIIEQFSPGMLGGQALAEILFGDINPSGRLTISFPYHVGQQPIFYAQVRGQHGGEYADMTQEPLFAFGEGLSYSTIEYGELNIKETELGMSDTVNAEIEVKNTGSVDAIETVQVYVSDLVTSATWVDKELKTFERIQLKAGESKTVNIELPVSECSIVNADAERVVEPGEFELRVGPSSRESVLKKATFNVQT